MRDPITERFCALLEKKREQPARRNIVVVDDFLADPDAFRELALSLEYHADTNFYQGRRSAAYPGLHAREDFETILGAKITKWDYPVHGAFQWCTPEDKLVYHMDAQTWAGVLYLTPGAAPEAGTSFFRDRERGYRMDPRLVHPGRAEGTYAGIVDSIFAGGFFDRTCFEEVDRVGNVYNRLVLWNGKMIHAASAYFGRALADARLTQVFFFDAE